MHFNTTNVIIKLEMNAWSSQNKKTLGYFSPPVSIFSPFLYKCSVHTKLVLKRCVFGFLEIFPIFTFFPNQMEVRSFCCISTNWPQITCCKLIGAEFLALYLFIKACLLKTKSKLGQQNCRHQEEMGLICSSFISYSVSSFPLWLSFWIR